MEDGISALKKEVINPLISNLEFKIGLKSLRKKPLKSTYRSYNRA